MNLPNTKALIIRARERHRHFAVEALEQRQLLTVDYLHVGDGGTDAIQRFAAETGEFVGALVASGELGLRGPRGVIVKDNSLLVVNQNVPRIICKPQTWHCLAFLLQHKICGVIATCPPTVQFSHPI
jgi:hypothetical protein